VPTLLRAARGTSFRWALRVSARRAAAPRRMAAAMADIGRRYGRNGAYLRLGGRPVVFVSESGASCSAAARWIAASRGRAYLMLESFPGELLCPRQPDGWYGTAGGQPVRLALPSSYTISPGRFPAVSAAPVLERDLDRFERGVREMVASRAVFQIVDSFNAWGEGTAIENARGWRTSTGYGAYLDALHRDGAAPPAPAPPGTLPTATGASVPVAPPVATTPPPPPPVTAPEPPPPAVTAPEPPPPPVTVPEPPPPPPGPTPAPSDPVIAAAGDISCDPAESGAPCREASTAALMEGMPNLAAVLPLGDNAYYCGSLKSYKGSFDDTWGRFKSIMRPTPGNHEYLTSFSPGQSATGCDASNAGARGYFQYFGDVTGGPDKGYYSFDVGEWHIVSLNSQCTWAGGCGPGSPQDQWLQADLAANTKPCILGFWHIPLFSSGGRANPNSLPFWNRLYEAGADVVLNGHDHVYERFAPQDPNGAPDPERGIREFVVGTGGANHTLLPAVAANSDVRNADTFGVLQLTLHADGYTWRFVPEAGEAFSDFGSGTCHS
jgi:calcineurin-like phosphoesterase family protein